jgi:hypothetical protein
MCPCVVFEYYSPECYDDLGKYLNSKETTWKEELLEWIEENSCTVYKATVPYLINIDELKQKIKEM